MRFFFIDRITRWEPANGLAEGLKNIALSEDFFDDHFPRRPVMPGVLILEGLAQLSGILLEEILLQRSSKDAKAVLTILEKTKFRALVHPGDCLRYQVEMLSINEAGGKVKAAAWRDDAIVTSTEMLFGFKYVEDPLISGRRRNLMEIWLRQG